MSIFLVFFNGFMLNSILFGNNNEISLKILGSY